jgi:hypothetical protein
MTLPRRAFTRLLSMLTRHDVLIRYIPTTVAQLAGEDSATLVRGKDRHRHFMLEPRPIRDLDPEFVALHRIIAERNARILYRGTDVASYNEPKALAQRR